MRSRKIEPSTVLGAFCVVVGIALVVLVTRDGGASASAERERGNATSALLDDESGGATTTTLVTAPALRSGVVEIPEGMRGVTIRVDFVAGVGGYAAPGDRVDIYATLDSTEEDGEPATELVLADVEVLDVSLQVAPTLDPDSQGPRAEGSSLTYLLSVDDDDVDEVVFHTRRADLYLALTPTPPDA